MPAITSQGSPAAWHHSPTWLSVLPSFCLCRDGQTTPKHPLPAGWPRGTCRPEQTLITTRGRWLLDARRGVWGAERMRPGQRVIPARGRWRMTPSLPRASLLQALHPSTRAPFGTSALCSSKMASARGNDVEKPGPPRQNAWIGSDGAAGRDLRSQFLCPLMGCDGRQPTDSSRQATP